VSRTLAIASKELRQLARDRLTMAMMALLPVVQLLLFGYAINTDVRHIPLVVYDQDRSSTSRDLVRRMEATGYYDDVGSVRSYAEIARALRDGSAKVGLVLPAGLGSALTLGRGAVVQLVVDGSDPMTVGSATETAASLLTSYSQELLVETMLAQGSASPRSISIEVATWYNPELRTAVYIVPGLIGVILTMTMVMLTAMAVARERERGTLEALIVSPVHPLEIVIGKIIPYVFIGYIQMTMVLLIGRFVFDVPIEGSLGLLYLLSAAFIAASLAVGLVFSTVAKTQQQAMQMSFFFLLPNILLAGFMFPFEGMPKPVQHLAQALPLTHFLRIVRRITLRGGGWSDVVVEFQWLCGLLVVIVIIAALRFKKKLL